MSSTSRGGQRSPADYYPTPSSCVASLMKTIRLPGGNWLEPAAGDGAIVRAITRRNVKWSLGELRQTEQAKLRAAAPKGQITIGDFLAVTAPGHFSVAITNPPFSLAQDFIDACLKCSDHVVMLLRLNYLASIGRYPFMSTHTPDIYVLPRRPSFTGGKTDSVEYAWFHWRQGTRHRGRLTVLAP